MEGRDANTVIKDKYTSLMYGNDYKKSYELPKRNLNYSIAKKFGESVLKDQLEESYNKIEETDEEILVPFKADYIDDDINLVEESIEHPVLEEIREEVVEPEEELVHYESVNMKELLESNIEEKNIELPILADIIEQEEKVDALEERKNEILKNIEEHTKEEVKPVFRKIDPYKYKTKEEYKSLDEIQKELEIQRAILEENNTEDAKTKLIVCRRVLSSLFRISGELASIPLDKALLTKVTFGTILINTAIKQINSSIGNTNKLVLDYKYKDTYKKANRTFNKSKQIRIKTDNSLEEINKVKENFKLSYEGVENLQGEYILTINAIDNLESLLRLQKNKNLR